jgi:hypothetical protein
MTDILTLLAGLLALVAAPDNIQSAGLETAVDDLEHGTLVFSYLTDDNVKGNGRDLEISLTDGDRHIYFHGNYERDRKLAHGPAEVRIKLRKGEVRDLEIRVGNRNSHPGDVNLGEVPASLAAGFLLDLARKPRLDEDVVSSALLGAIIARDVPVAGRLLDILGDGRANRDLRREAMFWAAHLSAEKALDPIRDVITDDDEDMDLREHAVFALAQMERANTLPVLMKIARNERAPRLQRAAFFALAEYDQPEVHGLFREILIGD